MNFIFIKVHIYLPLRHLLSLTHKNQCSRFFVIVSFIKEMLSFYEILIKCELFAFLNCLFC
jgi:hypothetical protein